jgi:deoxyinosine 3'endonuclease (endonuclease V)
MIYAFDSYYEEDKTRCVCLGFENWKSEEPKIEIVIEEGIHEEYISGEFYKRELPGILKILEKIALTHQDLIIIDGYVFIDNSGSLGLGGHLYNAIKQECPVVGVAKNRRKGLDMLMEEIYRGRSTKPLYVSSIGIGLIEVSRQIIDMRGIYRIPDMLRLLDQKTKKKV